MLRQSTLKPVRQLAARRFASTEGAKATIETGASKTKSATDQTANKLKQAVDSEPVQSSASAVAKNETVQSAADQAKVYAEQAQQYATKAFDAVGGRASNALGAYKEPIFYNFAVAREVAKQVYIAERLAPPSSFAEVRSGWETLYNRARDMGFWRKAIESGEWKRYAVYAVEAYGIFKIGEMLGRRSMVGYKLSPSNKGDPHLMHHD